MYSQLAYQWGGLGQLITFPQICSFYKGYSNVFSIKCSTSFQSFNIQVLILKQMFMLVGGLLLFSFQFNPTNFQLYNFHSFQYPFFQHFKGIYPCVRSQYSIRMVVQLQDEILYHIIKSIIIIKKTEAKLRQLELIDNPLALPSTEN